MRLFRYIRHMFKCLNSGVLVYEGGRITICKTCGLVEHGFLGVESNKHPAMIDAWTRSKS